MYSADGAAGTEWGGGRLTGPMILAALLAAMLLFGAMLSIIWKPRLGFVLTAAGFLLVAPWCSWLLTPGSWCAIGNCKSPQPFVAFDWFALTILVALTASLWLQRRVSRP